MLKLLLLSLFFLAISADFIHAADKIPAGVGKYKVVYKASVQEKTVFEDNVQVEKLVDSGYTLASLPTAIRKNYGEKVAVQQDHTVEKFSKLLLQPNEQKLMTAVLRNDVAILIKTKIDFQKFENGADLRKVFQSCYEQVRFDCDKRKKICTYQDMFRETRCKQNGHIFNDISSKASQANIDIVANGSLLEGVFNKAPTSWFLYLLARKQETFWEKQDAESVEDNVGAGEQIRKFLPNTKTYKDGDPVPGPSIGGTWRLDEDL